MHLKFSGCSAPLAIAIFLAIVPTNAQPGEKLPSQNSQCIKTLTQLENSTTSEIWLKFKNRYDTEETHRWDEPYGPYLSEELDRIEHFLSDHIEMTIQMSLQEYMILAPWFNLKGIAHQKMSNATNSSDMMSVKIFGPTRQVLQASLATENTGASNFFEIDSSYGGRYLTQFKKQFPDITVNLEDSLEVLSPPLVDYLFSKIQNSDQKFLFEVGTINSETTLNTIINRDIKIIDRRNHLRFKDILLPSPRPGLLLVEGNAADILRIASDERSSIVRMNIPGPAWDSILHRVSNFFRAR